MDPLDVMRQMYVEGQQKWPSIALAFEDFHHHCDRHCPDGSQLAKARQFAGEFYLCCACAKGDPSALATFKLQAEAVVRTAIARVRRDPVAVEDTLQDLWGKLLLGPDARVQRYSGRSPFQAWLRLCATRLAMDRQRASRTVSERETELSDCIADEVLGPESALTRSRFFEPFRAAARLALSQISRRERNLLRMHIVERCSIDQIGQAYGVHRATISRWLDRTRKRVLEAVRAELELGGSQLTDSEFQGIARLLAGELSLDHSLFATQSAPDITSTVPTR